MTKTKQQQKKWGTAPGNGNGNGSDSGYGNGLGEKADFASGKSSSTGPRLLTTRMGLRVPKEKAQIEFVIDQFDLQKSENCIESPEFAPTLTTQWTLQVCPQGLPASAGSVTVALKNASKMTQQVNIFIAPSSLSSHLDRDR